MINNSQIIDYKVQFSRVFTAIFGANKIVLIRNADGKTTKTGIKSD
jgi:hypothetical protein